MKKYLLIFVFSICVLGLTSFLLPRSANAVLPGCTPSSGSCYDWDDPPSFGCYIDCALGDIVSKIYVILIATTIILVLMLLYQTARTLGSGDSQKLQELPQKWLYLLLLAIIAIGAGGTVLNIFMKFLGFEGVGYWLDYFNMLLEKLT